MTHNSRIDLARDFFLPTLLFAALGGMAWAVRGCSGFGAVPGCIFAGVTWGAAWWFIAHDPSREQSRRYASGWIVLAVTVGVGLSGARGWMQWPSFFEGQMQTNSDKHEFVPIPRSYGFLWLFIAGVPWAGLGACLLAWCGSLRETRLCHWVIRIACGIGGAALARWLIHTYPQDFLPLYQSLEARYHDVKANPNLGRLTNDCGAALVHLGYYLGFLLYEVGRKDWKNAVLILTVGLVNGTGWALCQNWSWAPGVWVNASFNWWRCWESSGGISIGIAYGIAYFLVNRRMSDAERAVVASRRAIAGPNFEWLLVYFGLASYLSLFLGFRMEGWGPIYFAVVILFGAAYYFMNRGTPVGDALHESQQHQAGLKIEWGTALLAVVLIVGFFPQLRGRIVGLVTPSRHVLRDAALYYYGIAMALGLLWYLVRCEKFDQEKKINTPIDGDPNLERLGLYLGLLMGLGLSLRNGLKGWFNIYKGNEEYWSHVLWQYLGPVFLLCLIAIAACILFRPLPRNFRGRVFPHASGLMWLVLIVQNAIAQLITGPLTQWNEMAFSIYYALLFAITAAIVIHYGSLKRHELECHS
jgi:hypothetical protein